MWAGHQAKEKTRTSWRFLKSSRMLQIKCYQVASVAFLIEFLSISFPVPIDINYVTKKSVWLVCLGEQNLIPGCHLLILARVVSNVPLDQVPQNSMSAPCMWSSHSGPRTAPFMRADLLGPELCFCVSSLKLVILSAIVNPEQNSVITSISPLWL